MGIVVIKVVGGTRRDRQTDREGRDKQKAEGDKSAVEKVQFVFVLLFSPFLHIYVNLNLIF